MSSTSTSPLVVLIVALVVGIVVVGSLLVHAMGLTLPGALSLPSGPLLQSADLLPSNLWQAAPQPLPGRQVLLLTLAVSDTADVALEGIGARLVTSFAPNFSSEGAWHVDLYDIGGMSFTLGVSDPSVVEVQTGLADPPARIERIPGTWRIALPVWPWPLAGPPARLVIRNEADKTVFDADWTDLVANSMAIINAERGGPSYQDVLVVKCLPKACPELAAAGVPFDEIVDRLKNQSGMICDTDTWLSLPNIGLAYHPLTNPLVYKPSCP